MANEMQNMQKQLDIAEVMEETLAETLGGDVQEGQVEAEAAKMLDEAYQLDPPDLPRPPSSGVFLKPVSEDVMDSEIVARFKSLKDAA